jgi:hypothetical protein
MRLFRWIKAKRDDALTWIHALPDKGLTLRVFAFVAVLLLALGCLILINWLLRGGGLWGDLVFAIVIMTLALWILRRLQLSWFHRDHRFVLTRALAATLVVLVGIPIALVNWLAGAIILGGAFVVWAVVAIVRKWRKKSVPPLWPAAFVAVGLLVAVLFVQKPFTPSDTVPDAAPVPPAAAEGSDADLAMTFRPLLFFDSGESRYPLDIDEAIEEDRIDQCRKYLVVDRCPDVEKAEDIDMTFDYLDIDESAPPPRGGGDGSAYYYHVTRDGDRRFLDYWWFYSRNPSPVADKVFCGPGFRTPPFTCQEHAGDWEGMTVVVAPCEEESESCVDVGGELLGPTSVRYAQHAHLLSYAWARTLEPVWASLEAPQARQVADVWNDVVLRTIENHGVRPVAFVARNSHASYPDACFGNCRQEVGSLPEARYDGGIPWAHNRSCDDCLKPLPLDENGDDASWNAFPGRWGSQECILAGAYCDLSPAPRGPSFQRRYDEPTDDGEWICIIGTSSEGKPRLGRCRAR